MVLGGVPHDDAVVRIRSTVRGAGNIPTQRLVSDCLAGLTAAAGADRAVLHSVRSGVSGVVGVHPLDLRSQDARPDGPSDRLPWGLGSVHTDHFLFVRDARRLPVGPGSDLCLGELGTHSVVWLPVREHGDVIGSLTLCWESPRDRWDDTLGAIARNVARLLLGRLAGERPSGPQRWSAAPSDSAAASGRG